ncbi:hypothetical protein [Chitinophaga solisilvae]|uniref:Uncharacterized protein n=1 Tax=Chitinophaga solisilvae TaxID=1233460 RepID=A0A3S1JFW2_9BACT|nr:hypothetical protein [Chitinophaga solisilvae]NSL87637.1 hypothetical protein [Chitinophaga solisilvae]
MRYLFLLSLFLPVLLHAQTPVPPDVKVATGKKTAPRGSMDINGSLYISGKLFVENMGSADKQAALVGIDSKNRIVKIAPNNGGSNVLPINVISYELKNVNLDWVNDFDTKISGTDYVVTIAAYDLLDPIVVSNNRAMAPIRIETWVDANTKTWHLAADYVGTAPTVNSTWNLFLLVMNKSLAKTLSTITEDFGGNATKTAAQSPTGL